MQKGSLLLFVASLGIAWVHASTTSAGYCCPQITVALGTEEDGTYTFLREGDGPASDRCQNACLYSRDSNKTATYCFEAVEDLGSGQVQCEAISPHAVNGPTTGELLKLIEDLQGQLNTEVKAREAVEAEVNSIDGRLNKTEPRAILCGFVTVQRGLTTDTILTFDEVEDELSSGVSQGTLSAETGIFVAEVAGTYLITITASVVTKEAERLAAEIVTNEGKMQIFAVEKASGGTVRSQPASARYVRLASGEPMYINLQPGNAAVYSDLAMCINLVDVE